MTRFISVVSGKGGVGKSTMVANLAYAFTELGHDTIAVDSNLTTPHLGLHFGLHLAPKTLHDVLKGKEKISNVIYSHPYGFRIVPASMNVNDLGDVDPENLPEALSGLNDMSDIVLIDCAPGLGKEALMGMQTANEILVVTNPDLPAVADALKTLKVADALNKTVLGVIVNRRNKKRHELSTADIEEILHLPVLAEVPEDNKVSESVAAKQPLMNYSPGSPATIQIRKLAYSLSKGEVLREPETGFLERMFRWILG